MSISIASGLILATLLVAARLSAIFMVVPAFMAATLPMPVRAALLLSLSFCLAVSLPFASLAHLDTSALLAAVVCEVMQGTFLAFGAVAAFAALSLAGRLMDLQIGFGVVNLLDPTTRRQGPLLGTALVLLATAVFFATDGHLLFIKLFADSLQRFPPGQFVVAPDYALILKHFGLMFVGGTLLASPVLAVLFIIDIGLAMVSRSMPQLGVFMLSLPIKTAVGLITLAFLLGSGGTSAFNRVLMPMYDYMAETVYR